MQQPAANSRARARRIVAAASLSVSMILIAAPAPAGAASALVGQWGFDEGAGQVAQDTGPFGLHGVLGSSTGADAEDPLRVAGAAGGALRFGDNDYVQVADRRRLDLQALTVETVARAAGSPGAYRYLVAHGSRGCFAGAYGLYTAANGGLAFYVFDGERYFVSASARPEDVWDGGWHRVTGTFDGRMLRAFVDGREVGAPLATPEGTGIESASMPEGTYFGSYVGGCRLPFAGEMDSVRIWSDAVPAPLIAAGGGATPGAPGATGAAGAPGAPLAPAAAATIIKAQAPKSSCRVQVSRKQIPAMRRVRMTVRATLRGKPLRRVRLAVRRANSRKVIAAPRTNARGTAKLVLKIGRKGGRLRVGVVGRASCTPAFIKVAARR
ncbi:MAG: LamG domain-containing protein [Actinomycetota bacterium]|nr:LamG domain-containing protein [Actinomycetota bacterium]